MNELQNQNILQFTPTAEAYIQKLINQKETEQVFKLSLKEAGCSGYKYNPEILTRKEIKADDIELENAASFPVFVDAKCIKMITGTVVDYVAKALGHQMVFKNPNVNDECGCGESFNIKEDK